MDRSPSPNVFSKDRLSQREKRRRAEVRRKEYEDKLSQSVAEVAACKAELKTAQDNYQTVVVQLEKAEAEVVTMKQVRI